jgi:hypothetical protein
MQQSEGPDQWGIRDGSPSGPVETHGARIRAMAARSRAVSASGWSSASRYKEHLKRKRTLRHARSERRR